MRQMTIPCLMALCISACSASETSMNQTLSSDSGLQPVVQDRGLAKLNPNPKQAYEIVLTIENAPGPFAVVEGRAQFDVVNEDECGHINPTSGTAERITSNEPFALRKVSDTEYRGIVYFDLMQDEDYYGRGVCRWELSRVSAKLQASGADGEARFMPGIDSRQIVSGDSVTMLFWKERYPRSDVDNYPDYGETSLDEFRPEIRDNLFKLTIKAQGPQP